MRIAAVADLHGVLPDLPPCDVLLLGGDVTPTESHEHAFQAEWLDTRFRSWLEAQPATAIVGIAGNHDFVFDRAPELVPDDLPWTYLQDGTTTVEGLTIHGSPWTPWFGGWAFNAPRHEGETFLAEQFARAPADADVLLVHGPPRGYGDRTATGKDVGSTAQLELVDRIEPTLCVFGHIHEGRGRWERGRTQLLNCAAVDLRYALVDAPAMVVDL